MPFRNKKEGIMTPKIIAVRERLTLRHCQTDKFKAGTLSVSLVIPIERETTYLTSLLLSVLLRGTERYPCVSAINRRLDYLYGTELSLRNFYRGDCHIVGLSADFVEEIYLPDEPRCDSLLESASDMIRELLFHPTLDANGCLRSDYVESEKTLQCDAIRAQKNQPQSYASERCRSLLYQNEPCGIPIYGTEEEVRAVTPQILTAHFHKLLSQISLQCFYVGRSDSHTVAAVLDHTFSKVLSQATIPELRVFPVSVVPAKQKTLYSEEPFPAGQGHLVLGLRTGVTVSDPAFYACTLFNELLGASPISRLFMNVREKLSLCYSCNSVYNIYKGTILISCGLQNENRCRAEQAILCQIQDLAEGAFSTEEWIAAKKSLENAYHQLEDSPTALESFYFGRGLVGTTIDVAQSCRQFSSVTREEVMDVAQKIRLDTVFFLKQTGNGEEVDEDED